MSSPRSGARLAAVLALTLAACGAHPPEGGAGPATVAASDGSSAAAEAPGSAPSGGRLPGDRLVLRFVEQSGAAVVEGDLPSAWKSGIPHPHRALLPYSKLSGAAAYRAVQISFGDANLDRYATVEVEEGGRRPENVVPVDPVWNRTRAVYQSRQALYVPAGTAQSYRVRVPQGGVIETAFGLLSSSQAPARFRVTVDGAPLLDDVVPIPGKWIVRSAALPPGKVGTDVVVRFSVDAAGGGSARLEGFFADPVLWARGGGAPGPNLLFILLDTLRTDVAAVTPHLRDFASTSASFEQAITSATWTRPAMLGMYGGDLPTAVGQGAEKMVHDDIDRKRFYRLGPPLLPRILAAHGYRVTGIGNNFFLLGYPTIGLDLGFEEVDDVRHPVKDTPAITRGAVRFLEENRDRPFFLHVHYDATHWPYTPPEKYLAPAVTAPWKGDPVLLRDPYWRRYLGEAAFVDDNVGQLLEAVARLGLGERTLVVIVGDHGEIFDPEHDQIVEALGERTLHHHGWAGYDELLRVPLYIGLPGAIAPAVVKQQVRSFDLAPTILDYLGITDGGLPPRGRSLRPLMEGHPEPLERVAFTEGQNIRVVRAGGWAYLRREDPRLKVRGTSVRIAEELYDLEADPQQHDNLAGRRPEDLARMRSIFAGEAPAPPAAEAFVYHLRLAPDEKPHRLQGILRSEGRIALRGLTGAGTELTPLGEHEFRLLVPSPGGIDFMVDPPDSGLELQLTRDGLPVDTRRVLAGEYALPLLDGDPTRPLDSEHIRRLDARRAPQLGERGDVLLWRDPGAPEPLQRLSRSDTEEVTGMMQRWGYAQGSTRK